MAAAQALSQALPIVREKREATLRDRCSLVRIAMHRVVDDYGRTAFLLTRGPMVRELPSLDAVEAFLEERNR